MALYRKYRPGSFGELVGQEQVAVPLSAALDNNRINHAYLFSGPRGCGKTSSARIMARSLNCVQGPTSTPCGVCNSCIALAPNGPGNLDVTELDAASHNGVDDMRELRDRAMYAPAESRYRIFIIDEAHMITNQGSNALLKIVEEPPAHLIFIFATTEPEKVIGTIRSRTHHYPFRLLTPQAMRGLLERTVAAEGMRVEDSVYPMVIRAGGGSPRDTLSVLDQLLAGTGPEGLTYDHARMLLGATDDALIDSAITALAADDKAGLFVAVDNVIEAGLSPRKFSEDLLDRLRDLMLLQAVPDAITMGLVDAPTDRAEVLSHQAQTFQPARLPHIAATLNDGLTSLKGATSPRLLLEILCAKMLIDSTPQVLMPPATSGGVAPDKSASPPAYQRPSQMRAEQPKPETAAPKASTPAYQRPSQQAVQQSEPQPAPVEEPAPATYQRPSQFEQPVPQQETPSSQPSTTTQPPAAAPSPPAEPTSDKPAAADPFGKIQAAWSDVRSAVARANQVTAILVTEARPLGMTDNTIVLGHNTGALASRINSPEHRKVLVAAIKETTDLDVDVKCEIGTDPKAHGFDVSEPPPVWNPEVHAQTTSEPELEPTPEPEPAPQAPEAIEAPTPVAEVVDTTIADIQPQPAPEPEPAPQAQMVPAPEPEPVPEPEPAPEPADPWGPPAQLGGEPEPEPVQPPTPAAPQMAEAGGVEKQEKPARPTWMERGKAAAAKAAALAEEIPPPPEPDSWDAPPPPEEQSAQEDDMWEQASSEVGTADHRDAMTVAMDMLSQELGARPL